MSDLNFEKMSIPHFSAPGFYSYFDGCVGVNDICSKMRMRKYNPYSKELKCKNCGAYGKGITFYNHEDYKLCKNCFLEMKKKQREEQGE